MLNFQKSHLHYAFFLWNLLIVQPEPNSDSFKDLCSARTIIPSLFSPVYFLKRQIDTSGIILFIDSPFTLQAKKSVKGLYLRGISIHSKF